MQRIALILISTTCCAIIKHTNPCGIAEADDLSTAWSRALAGDRFPHSAVSLP
ncbi:MAG: hypothetical protein IPG01_18370 [Chitinophagaceae bacterium]|nr:hypothetical protein [Chitinophagaceae bacterium]